MPKNISKLPQYVVAINITDKETNATFDVYAMNETAETWAITTNIGDAFMFFNKDTAKYVAKEFAIKCKEDEEDITFNHLAIISIVFDVKESEVIEL